MSGGKFLPGSSPGSLLRSVKGSKVLALGGTTASLLTLLGGFLGQAWLIGCAGLTMLTANVYVLARPTGSKRPTRR